MELKYLCFLLCALAVLQKSVNASNDFHIRHYYGKCLLFKKSADLLLLRRQCKDKFRWQDGLRLVHVFTKKCMATDGNSDGSSLKLTTSCSGINTVFQYDSTWHEIQHIESGKCIQPSGNEVNAAEGTNFVLGPCHASNKSKFWFLAQILYVIRHWNQLCLNFHKDDGSLKFVDDYQCTRFRFRLDGQLESFEARKVLGVEDGVVKPVSVSNSNCCYHTQRSTLSTFDDTKCLHPDGTTEPKSGTTKLVLQSCGNTNGYKFHLYDDRYILTAKIRSQSCDDAPGKLCENSNGRIVINGYDFSDNKFGFNAALFDYRSGLYEEKAVFNTNAFSSHRSELVAFLNNVPSNKILFIAAKGKVTVNAAMAQALQKHGVSATFARTISGGAISLASISFTGMARKIWEISVNRGTGGAGPSNIDKVIHIFHDLKGTDECSEEMGLRSYHLDDAKMKSKTNVNTRVASSGRLIGNGLAWCGTASLPRDYLQVDVGAVKIISGIALQGDGAAEDHHVTKFKVEYSSNGATWKTYKESGSADKELDSYNTKKSQHVRVNWFLIRLIARYIRFVPTARKTTGYRHCSRIELFGCAPKSTLFLDHFPPSKSVHIGEYISGNVAFYGYETEQSSANKLTVGMSMASENTSLATSIEQVHLSRVNETTVHENGTILQDVAYVKKISDKLRKIYTRATVEYTMPNEGYYNFDVGFGARVLDSGKETGKQVWNTYSFETHGSCMIISHPMTVNRRTKDQATLQLELNSTRKEFSKDGTFLLNVTIFQVGAEKELGRANAYSVDLFLYYNSLFLQLISSNVSSLNEFSTEPTRSVIKPGILHFHNDAMWLLSNQFIQIKFKISKPAGFAKRYEGEILYEFKYLTNTANLNGKLNVSTGKSYSYVYKVQENGGIETARLSVPVFSMVYDEYNEYFFVCKVGGRYSMKNHPFCYWQGDTEATWKEIPYIASVVGIDTTNKILFGIDRMGTGYFRLPFPFSTFGQIEDSEWTSIETQPRVQTAKTATDISSLPQRLVAPWVYEKSGKQIWGATNNGVFKKGASSWHRVFEL